MTPRDKMTILSDSANQ